MGTDARLLFFTPNALCVAFGICEIVINAHTKASWSAMRRDHPPRSTEGFSRSSHVLPPLGGSCNPEVSYLARGLPLSQRTGNFHPGMRKPWIESVIQVGLGLLLLHLLSILVSTCKCPAGTTCTASRCGLIMALDSPFPPPAPTTRVSACTMKQLNSVLLISDNN